MKLKSFLKNPASYIKSIPFHIQKSNFGSRYIIPKISSLAIEPTNKCNLRCTMCTAQVVNKENLQHISRGFMDFLLFKKIIDEASILKINNIGLNYAGEALLHPKFPEMLLYAGKQNIFNLGFNTNGDLLSEKIQDYVIKYCRGTIGISIDGFQDTHEYIRKGSNYNLVKRNVINLITKRNQKKQNFPKIKINLTHSTQSKSEISRFIKYWIDYADYVQINTCYDENYSIVTSLQKEKDTTIHKRLPCYDPLQYIGILWDGRITICCNDLKQIGLNGLNAKDTSLKKIWRSNEYRKARLNQSMYDFSYPSFCRNCDEWIKHHTCNQYIENDHLVIDNGTNKRYFKKYTSN